jgi:hypothetical protein
MQTIVQVIAKPGPSLRKAISNDRKLSDFKLEAVEFKRADRKDGWAKISATDGSPGVINVEWDGATNILTCRVINKLGGRPHTITAAFVSYLLAHKKSRIRAVQVIIR